MQYRNINQRLADTRDRMWAKSMMGRHSTLADRRVRYPRDEQSSPREFRLLARFSVRIGKFWIWLGQHWKQQRSNPIESHLPEEVQ